MVVVFVNIDKHRSILKTYGIRGIPTLLAVRPDGAVVKVEMGGRTAEEIVAGILKATR
jgi:thioredoxin-like negative regulator of GroEL